MKSNILKKRILCVLLCLTLIIPMFQMTASAMTEEEYMDARGRVAGIDYKRIKRTGSLRVPVTISIGGVDFKGWLKNGKMLEDEAVDQIIRQVMFENDIDQKFFAEANYYEKKAAQIDPNFNIYAFLELAGRFWGLGSAIDATSHSKSGTDLIISELEGQIIGKLIGMGATGGVATLLGGLANCSDAGMKLLMEKVRNNETIQIHTNYQIALLEFYAEVNRRIYEQETERGTQKWELTCNSTVVKNIDFMGVEVPQYWKLELNMKKAQSENSNMKYVADDYGGGYIGSYQLDIWHNLTAFDAEYLDKVYFSNETMQLLRSMGNYEFYDSCQDRSTLKKRISNPTAYASIDKAATNLGLDGQIKLDKYFVEKQDFWSQHTVFVVPDNLPITVNTDGSIDIGAYYNGNLCSIHYFEGWMGNKTRADLELNVSEIRMNGVTHIPRQGDLWYNKDAKADASLLFVSDSRMYNALNGGCMSISFGWGEGYEWIK